MIAANVLATEVGHAKRRAAAGILPPSAWCYRPHGPQFGADAAMAAQGRPLDSLSGSSVAGRFRSWRGRSGRRYVFSVFVVAAGSADLENIPLDQEAVAIVARRGGDGLETLWCGRLGGARPVGREFAALAGQAGCEIHVHLLAQGEAERQAIVDDLAAA